MNRFFNIFYSPFSIFHYLYEKIILLPRLSRHSEMVGREAVEVRCIADEDTMSSGQQILQLGGSLPEFVIQAAEHEVRLRRLHADARNVVERIA